MFSVGNDDDEEARNLQKMYGDCLQRAEDLQIFEDGQSQALMKALIETEIKADIQVPDSEEESSPLQSDGVEEGAGLEEEAGVEEGPGLEEEAGVKEMVGVEEEAGGEEMTGVEEEA